MEIRRRIAYSPQSTAPKMEKCSVQFGTSFDPDMADIELRQQARSFEEMLSLYHRCDGGDRCVGGRRNGNIES